MKLLRNVLLATLALAGTNTLSVFASEEDGFVSISLVSVSLS